ncbi:MAG: hypothetical protein SFW67_28485 [Myxococcaceae bacterium]|nr:hypothetical protein [Myxococcaceae bacterium]
MELWLDAEPGRGVMVGVQSRRGAPGAPPLYVWWVEEWCDVHAEDCDLDEDCSCGTVDSEVKWQTERYESKSFLRAFELAMARAAKRAEREEWNR